MMYKLALATLIALTAKISDNVTDMQCMIANLYFEARGESIKGMKAVAAVTLNRVKSKRYPSSICSVVFQRKQFSWTHQKSWPKIEKILLGNTEKLKKEDLAAYLKAVSIAEKIESNSFVMPELLNSSMFYHANYVYPKWASEMQKVAVIGTHIFYKG